MKGNYGTLVEFAQEIERIANSAVDYRVPAGQIEMILDSELKIGADLYPIQKYAHGQIANKLGIPKEYYDRMAAIPGLRAHNVNEWLAESANKSAKESFLVRTLDGEARAFLSNKYRVIDNVAVMQAVLPAIKRLSEQTQSVKVKSQSLTPEKMYLQIVFPGVSGEVVPGDVVQAGVTITNSEIGSGTFTIEQFVYRLVCSNGMIGQRIIGQKHVGRRIGTDEVDARIFRSDTVQAEGEAYKKIVRDVFDDAIKGAWFQSEMARMRAAAVDVIPDPVSTIERMVDAKIVTHQDAKSILMVTQNNDWNRWGLANSITALAHDIEDPDRQYQYESLGNTILTMPQNKWQALVKTA